MKKYKYTSFGFNDQISMFRHIWDTRPHISVISGKNLDLVPDFLWISCFAHILPKGGYKKYELNPDNIMLMLPVEHMLIDQGTIDQRAKYEEEHGCSFKPFYDKKEELYQMYRTL